MIHAIVQNCTALPALVVFLLAGVKGGAPERRCAVIMGLIWAFSVVMLPAPIPKSARVFIYMMTDIALAFALLALAVAYGRLWLGAAMLFQSVPLALHAMTLSDDSPGYGIYVVLLNLMTCLTLVCLLTGTLTAWRRRGEVADLPRAPLQPSA